MSRQSIRLINRAQHPHMAWWAEATTNAPIMGALHVSRVDGWRTRNEPPLSEGGRPATLTHAASRSAHGRCLYRDTHPCV